MHENDEVIIRDAGGRKEHFIPASKKKSMFRNKSPEMHSSKETFDKMKPPVYHFKRSSNDDSNALR